MGLHEIRKYIAEQGCQHLLQALPSHETLRWVLCTLGSPAIALFLGTADNRDIFAYLVRHGDKSHEMRFCARPVDSDNDMYPIQQDEVMQMPLDAPFKYNADDSNAGKRRFKVFVKWYFMAKGLLEDKEEGENSDYCRRFLNALKVVDEGRTAESISRRELVGGHATPSIVEQSPQDVRTTRGLCPTDPGNSSTPRSIGAKFPTPGNATPPVNAKKNDNEDLTQVRNYLDSVGMLHLLQNIPEPDQLQFFDQKHYPLALPKKLFVGHDTNNNNEIFAYMRYHATNYVIAFLSEGEDGSTTIINQEHVAKSRILHPFNKTYPKSALAIDQTDKSRFSIMVKWYFLAAGIANGIVLKEVKGFPEKFRAVLEFIARRMGSAAVQPPVNQTLVVEPLRVVIPSVHKDQTQSTSTATVACAKTVALATTVARATSSPLTDYDSPTTDYNLPSQQQTALTPRAAKRSAEDVAFEDLRKSFAEEQRLTKEVDKMNANLENLDAERQAFLAQWERQHSEVMEKKRRVDNDRKTVRKNIIDKTRAIPDIRE
ncbi:hypothetical protein BKA66DRAFT_474249 [Pyrenochaeta sp. MPI-SDFR-AT-0127]|nr:hypothetical protein BKA66DRAFT_474249 [Pyrenochaeta sp. MPI-SDFR-AT-0127]